MTVETVPMVFEVSNLEKRFADIAALDGVSLSIPGGACTVLIGPSGCGKSTLLNCLNGLVLPSNGEVLFRGGALGAGDELVRMRREIGYVIQEGGLFRHLSAAANVELVAKMSGWDQQRRANRVRELAELTRLDVAQLDKYPDELSGGQRQRVALMRALMLDPDALLLDEPMGALDPLTRAELQLDLRVIFRELSKTVVLVTHDLAEAAYLGDSIVLMKDGKIVQRGTMAELQDEPADDFVRAFLQAQRQIAQALQ